MAEYKISNIPQEVPEIDTKFRKIKTKIPVPESFSVFNDLEKYEARSMHGQLPIVWDRAEDFQVFDKYGNCWIDFTSTIFLTNTGHSNPRIISAIKEGADKKLLHTYTYAHESRVSFLKKLIETTPSYLEKAFLLSSGTEATECALKLMRMYGQTVSSSKLGIISFSGSMHGRTMGAEMLKGSSEGSAWVGYQDPNMYHLPFPCPWSENKSFSKDIEDLQRKTGINFDDVCGFMIESYQGWGAILYPKEYIKDLCDFAKKHNILVTFDEIQGGFGRTGKQFVYEHYEVEPDLVCLGKALTGSLPLSAVIGKKELLDLPETGSMSSTHSANPLCCLAGLANLEEIESRNLVSESARKGEILHYYLNKLKERFPNYISYILGKGMLAAIITSDDGSIASRVSEKAMQKGLILVHTGRESIKIGPPLTICDEALIEGIKVIEESFEEAIKESNQQIKKQNNMKAVRHTGIVISNLEKSLNFYKNILGLEVKVDALESGKFIDDISGLKDVEVRTIKMTADDGGMVELLWYKSHPRNGEGAKDICVIGVSHVAFTVEDIEYEYKRLKEEGIEFHCSPQVSADGKAKVTFCHDPEGNLVELVEELN